MKTVRGDLLTVLVEDMPFRHPHKLRRLLRSYVSASVRAELVFLAFGAFAAHEADVFAH